MENTKVIDSNNLVPCYIQKLYIMQGIPGSGKSTLARKIHFIERNSVICSTDDYFYQNEKGTVTYKFDANKLAEFHSRNLERAIQYMNEKKTVIIDNTNIRRSHCFPYVKHAVNLGIEVIFIRVTSKFKSIHEVPEIVLERMEREMENLTVESVMNYYNLKNENNK